MKVIFMRKIRSKFKNPRMSWDSADISTRKGILKDYGLRRRKEILIAQEILRNFRRRARELIAEKDEKKIKTLLDKLERGGLLSKDQGLDDVLALSVNDILERRLQTIVWKGGLTTTARSARQLIAHGHVSVSGKKVKSPAYMVATEEEKKITVDKTTGERGGK